MKYKIKEVVQYLCQVFGIAVIFLVLIGLCMEMLGYEDPQYKQGQIDAINGLIKYELVTNPDSTKTWETIHL